MNVERQPLSRSIVYLMAFACGAIVANLYYAQPLIETIGHALHTSPSTASFTIAIIQGGYALGLFFIVPLGDIVNKKTLIVSMLLLTSLSLFIVAISPSLAVFAVGSFAVGLTAVTAQIIVPHASLLAPPEQRGKVVGTVMSGLLIGILFARTLSGLVAQAFGWRSVYVSASVLTIILAITLWKYLPDHMNVERISYPALLRSVISLLSSEPVLRTRSIYGALSFGMFSAFWASAALLLSKPPYSFNNAVIGMFGLIGVAGAFGANLAGRRADKGHARSSTLLFVLAALLAYVALTVQPEVLFVLIPAVLLLDLGVQGIHVTNQTLVFSLHEQARSRLSSAYMTSFFIGGAVASTLSTIAFSQGGWTWVGSLGIVMALASVGLWLRENLTEKTKLHSAEHN